MFHNTKKTETCGNVPQVIKPGGGQLQFTAYITSFICRQNHNGEVVDRSWLCFSPSQTCVKCFTCRLLIHLLSEFFKPLLSRTRSRGRRRAANRLSHRPEPSGRAVHEEVDGLDNGGQHGWLFVLLRHTHRPQRRLYSICTSSSRNVRHQCEGGLSRTQAVFGRVIPGGWVPVSGMQMRSLVGLSAHSAFHWWSAQCAACMLLL